MDPDLYMEFLLDELMDAQITGREDRAALIEAEIARVTARDAKTSRVEHAVDRWPRETR